MPTFSRLIKFQSARDNGIYFADLGKETDIPAAGTTVKGYKSFEDVGSTNASGLNVEIGKLLAPLPYDGIPIYCVGLNYRTHAKEASVCDPDRCWLIQKNGVIDMVQQLNIPKNPPLWTKPTASLANPDEDIPMNKFCASTLPDYEGELVFVTSRTALNLSPSEAKDYILGYTCGNAFSCRLHQMPDQAGGQFYFAKAFDKFAPMGPVLVSPRIWEKGEGVKLVTRVNGEVKQDVEVEKDMIFGMADVLSRMSQGTTIPAGTPVMTGTPAGVGVFMEPRSFLKDGDVIEVEISKIGTLKNKIVYT